MALWVESDPLHCKILTIIFPECLITESHYHYSLSKGKVHPCKALRLFRGLTAHRGSRGIALLFLDHGTRRGEGFSVTPRPLFTPGKDLEPILQEAG